VNWRMIAFALALFVRLASAQIPGHSFTIQGHVRDAHGAAIAGASVSLQGKNGDLIKTVPTDTQGAYRFAKVDLGTYTLRARMNGYEERVADPFVVENSQHKNIDLTLSAKTASERGVSSTSAMPQFSDEPNFTVAGVTDTTNLGGHGSDVVVRNREGLVKATVSLGGTPSIASPPTASLAATEKSLRAVVDRDPSGYEANYRLGKLLVEEDKAREAIPYLERALQVSPAAYEGEYELALAHCASGKYAVAESETQALLAHQDEAELHHLLAEIEEKRNNPLEALRQYQRAAEMDASESNLFDWGAELLLHQAPEPATEVFTKGSRLFPASVRMMAALGAAWYARGSYDQAVQSLCSASDLDPNALAPYLFLGRIQKVEANESPQVITRLERFARLQPRNALANYYYAVSLWKQRTGPDDTKNLPQIESLLNMAVHLDPKLGAAYLQLGIWYSEEKKSSAAIAAFQKSVESAPELPDAHYRLAQAYRQAGEKLKAQQELELYDQTSKNAAEEVERERHEVRQFVYTLRNRDAASDSR
jgi:tetratricopeptide (TPR) repeat protein